MVANSVGAVRWVKRQTLAKAGIVVRSVDDWVLVRLLKKGGVAGTEKDRWLVSYGEDEATLSKQSLKRRRPGDASDAVDTEGTTGVQTRPSRSAPPETEHSGSTVQVTNLRAEVGEGLEKSKTLLGLDLAISAKVNNLIEKARFERRASIVGDEEDPFSEEYVAKVAGKPGTEVEHEVEWVVHPMGKHPEELPRDPAAATLDVSCFRPSFVCRTNLLLLQPKRVFAELNLPPKFEDWTREHARAVWQRCWPGTERQVRNYNSYITEHLKYDNKFRITEDKWTDFNLVLLTATLFPGNGFTEYKASFDPETLTQPMNLGQFLPVTDFVRILRHSHWAFCRDKSQWGRPELQLQWSMIVDFIEAFNENRAQLLGPIADMLGTCIDEIMVEWVSKGSLEGGLPNITHEPRKPKPLGTMLKVINDVRTGIIRAMEIVESPDSMEKKAFFADSKAFAGDAGNKASACTLRLASLTPKGSHICGDAWFGSVTTAIMLKKQGYDFTGIVKGKTYLYPYQALRDRASNLKRGEWISATATICGVKLLAIMYRFSYRYAKSSKDPDKKANALKGVNFLISTVGSATPGMDYAAHWTDENGMTHSTLLRRASIISFYFGCATKTDDHDNVRQSKLAVEESWRTTNCWTRLHHSFIGIVTTDIWKLLDAGNYLPPSQVGDRCIPIRRFVDLFAKKLWQNDDESACELRSFDKFAEKIVDPRDHRKKPRTDQYHRSVCKQPGCSYRAHHYCHTCFEASGLPLSERKRFACCGSGTGRPCFEQHQMDAQHERLQKRRRTCNTQ